MIKLIASDIDGTLVQDGENTLNPEFYDEILRLRAKGIQFAVATGRQWHSIEQVFNPIKEKIFYISDNGAYVGCHGRNLFLTTIDRQTILEMIQDVRTYEDLDLMLSGPDVVYLETENKEFVDWLVDSYRFQVKQVPDLTKVEDQFIKISIYRKHQVEEHTTAIREAYQDKLKITISGDMWVDCMAKGVSKGAAIQQIQESLGILPEETMAFGDQLNDMEMLERAYYSYAIGNARPEVKKAARFQADTNINYGVLKVLKLL
ncbi:MAG: HAD family phosphatase [Lachnospiraceae bacterium]|jgi:Cof subfamily protein (haloacid dehalogenase superfamily)|nr:HAD family phosphatase [Lachnospiraceae bacterium]